MAQRTLRYRLDGDVTLDDLRDLVAGLSDLVETLSDDSDPKAPVVWVVAVLRRGSADVGVRGRYETDAGRHTVAEVEDRYGRIADAVTRGRDDELPPHIRPIVARMTAMLNGRVPSATMAVGKETWKIDRPVAPLPPVSTLKLTTGLPSARTSIKGRVVKIESARRTYFTLEEAFTKRKIRCFPSAEWRAKIGSLWGEDSWILVEGTYRSFMEDPSLTDITDIVSIGKAEPGGWRRAMGIAPRAKDGLTDSAAELVRRVRDAE